MADSDEDYAPWEFGGIKSSDLDAFLQVADPVGQVLKGHLAVEAVLGEALDVRMERPVSFRRMRLSFARKVQLSVALGVLGDVEEPAFSALNAIRNSLAHEYHYSISEQDADRLIKALPTHWLEMEPVKEFVEAELSKRLRLGILVVYTMAGRAVERELNTRKAFKRLQDVLEKRK